MLTRVSMLTLVAALTPMRKRSRAAAKEPAPTGAEVEYISETLSFATPARADPTKKEPAQ